MTHEVRQLVRSHLKWFLAHAPFGAGGHGEGALWISSLNLVDGSCPTGGRPVGIPKRCYRYIEAPGGSNLYWDLPLVAACHAIARADGDEACWEPARAYLRAFITQCQADSGLFWWGNHYYVDAATGNVLWFYGDGTVPKPIGPGHARPWLHELRPLRVPWALLAQVDAQAVRRAIGAMATHHIYDTETGGFNRHADGKRGFAFLEAGGILAESLCWGATRFGRPEWIDAALSVARYSYRHRDPNTGLISNSPDVARWDQTCSTSEVGLWARCMIRCSELTGDGRFARWGCDGLGAWLEHAWDDQRGRFVGMVDLASGRAALSDPDYAYMPGDDCDPWAPLFPAHDYPMPCAEACLDAWIRTQETRFSAGAERWLAHLASSLPARDGRGGYAEHYGRAIRFTRRAGVILQRDTSRLTQQLIAEAVAMLGVGGERLRSHPGEDRCDAVDGMGHLCLALTGLDQAGDALEAPW